MNTGVAKAALGIKRPLVGTETNDVQCCLVIVGLGIKRPLVGTETHSMQALRSPSLIRN